MASEIKPAVLWASVYPGQHKLRWAGIFPTARECWEDCEWDMKCTGSATRAEMKAAGYRVVRVKVGHIPAPPATLARKDASDE